MVHDYTRLCTSVHIADPRPGQMQKTFPKGQPKKSTE